MAASQHEHSRARREVLQVMYQNELTGTPLPELVDGTGDTAMLLVPECPEGVSDNDLVGVELAEYADRLLTGIVSHLDEIDGWIAETARNWTLERMPIVDRNIIRIAAYEIGFCDDIPTGVAINEAVEIAKAFGTDESPKFVNGVLGRIALRIDAEDADAASALAAEETLEAGEGVSASERAPEAEAAEGGEQAGEGGSDGE